MASTRERILALMKQSPHLNQTEIAERLGVSRQRVAQIVVSEELELTKGKRGARGRAKPPAQEAAPAYNVDALPKYLANAGGPVAVLIAAADLITRGYAVYLPVAPTAAADLVAIDHRGRVKRFDVKTKRRAGPVEYPTGEQIDVRAFVTTDEPVKYAPEL